LKKYFFVGLGGFLGAISRYYIKNIIILDYSGSFPLNTFVTNITGSFLLAFLLTAALLVKNFDEDIRLGIGTGFLGAYTTFSTFCKESTLLMNRGLYFTAGSYMLFSALLGIASSYLGAWTGKKVAGK
jgi:CrcB protein